MSTAKQLGVPRQNAIELNLPVLLFTFVLAVLSGIVFGVIPALQTSRPDLHDELKGGAGASVTGGRAKNFTSNALVVGEIGLSLLLLIAAGLLLKDFAALRNINVGVRTEGIWTAALRLPEAAYKDDRKQYDFGEALLARLRQIPGVESASLTTVLPTNGGSNSYVNVRGEVFKPMSGPLVESHAVTPGYFHTLGIPLIAGRDFTEQDVQRSLENDIQLKALFKDNNTPPKEVTDPIIYPAVINQAMAKAIFKDKDPIGQLWSTGNPNGPWSQVIGVVGDVKQWGLVSPPQPEGYNAFDGSTRLYIVLHTSTAPGSITSAVRHAVGEIERSAPIYSIRTMDEVIGDQAANQQFVTSLVGAFAGLALLLAAVGIYGVLSYLVTQRTREIGIRMSLGARRGDVLQLVLGHGVRLAIAGCIIGVAGAFAATRIMANSMAMVKGHDPRVFGAAIVALVGVAVVACYIPARRATKVDPMVALRYE